MARVGRVAGSLFVETNQRFALVGFPKEPCDFEAHGLAPPPPLEHWEGPFCWVDARGPVNLGGVVLEFELEDVALLHALSERLLIARNGSVSERLWRLVVDADEEGNVRPGTRSARYLTEMPPRLWNILRETVLRCS